MESFQVKLNDSEQDMSGNEQCQNQKNMITRPEVSDEKLKYDIQKKDCVYMILNT